LHVKSDYSVLQNPVKMSQKYVPVGTITLLLRIVVRTLGFQKWFFCF